SALSGLNAPDPITKTKRLCAPSCCHKQGCFRVDNSRIVCHRLVDLCSCSHFTKDIQVIVARCAVGAQGDLHSSGKHFSNRSNTCCKFEVAFDAVRNRNIPSSKKVYFPVIKPHAVSGKQPIAEKTYAFQVLDRPFAM